MRCKSKRGTAFQAQSLGGRFNDFAQGFVRGYRWTGSNKVFCDDDRGCGRRSCWLSCAVLTVCERRAVVGERCRRLQRCQPPQKGIDSDGAVALAVWWLSVEETAASAPPEVTVHLFQAAMIHRLGLNVYNRESIPYYLPGAGEAGGTRYLPPYRHRWAYQIRIRCYRFGAAHVTLQAAKQSPSQPRGLRHVWNSRIRYTGCKAPQAGANAYQGMYLPCWPSSIRRPNITSSSIITKIARRVQLQYLLASRCSS